MKKKKMSIPLPKRKPSVPKRKGSTSMSIEEYFKDPKNQYEYGADRTSGLKPVKKKAGGYMKKNYSSGGKLKMVEKDGKKVPFYAADGKGKMMAGGKVKKYAKGGKIGRGCGAALRGGGIVMKS